jgi:hypothetical protein
VPARFWRLITVRYPDGRQLALVYTAPPADPAELPSLVWQLQCAAGAYGFEITVTADRITTQAAPISLPPARAGA